ncbi:MAG TPA: M20/M25/M40 family metallo-hydrolase [Pelolinea sp.]|nr:M20/M25/M40 family metallo-hydrolase [Pelolinea sp.]
MASINSNELKAYSDKYQGDILGFLQDLVQIPSVNGWETEKMVAVRVLKEAQKWELPARLVARDTDRPNALVTIGEGEKGFALIGHMDTVAEGKREDWTFPPFSATLDGNLLFGRGAADNKAGIACGLYTLVLLRESGLLDMENIYVTLAGAVDKESGACSPLGVRYLLDSGSL